AIANQDLDVVRIGNARADQNIAVRRRVVDGVSQQIDERALQLNAIPRNDKPISIGVIGQADLLLFGLRSNLLDGISDHLHQIDVVFPAPIEAAVKPADVQQIADQAGLALDKSLEGGKELPAQFRIIGSARLQRLDYGANCHGRSLEFMTGIGDELLTQSLLIAQAPDHLIE